MKAFSRSYTLACDFGQTSFDALKDLGPVCFLHGGHRWQHSNVIGSVAAVKENHTFIEDGLAGVLNLGLVAVSYTHLTLPTNREV